MSILAETRATMSPSRTDALRTEISAAIRARTEARRAPVLVDPAVDYDTSAAVVR